ncbi:MAG: hypothetical protein HY235_22690 [Acidobacteria bacterium]|nr:hypothetical protein [Acidobacteriota bacterium]
MDGVRSRGVLTLAWLVCAAAYAQPQLTTVEDTVYRADGQRFSGIAMIEWRSFLAADASTVAAYSKNVRIVDGVLKVSLVPTTTASAGAYYLVRYNSNGRIQFVEYWAVSPSTTSLKLKDVRLVGPPVAGAPVSGANNTGPVQITDVVGLTDELTARPRKGLGFAASRAAVINSTGTVDSATGQPTDCVRVNGTSGPCDVSISPVFVDNETPAGQVNGTNAAFTLSNPPDPASSLQFYRNGVLQRTATDYTLSGNVITFQAASIPQAGDLLLASFRLAGSSGQTGGQAGGALTGYYPSPNIAPGAVSDMHIAPNAAIGESKLALTFPTHSAVNDPTAEQKAALAGTAGSPSNTNRFVTDQDTRMTNARPPATHGLLAGAHFDSNPGVVSRGDLIVGIGTSPTLWSRLSLGAANRCLTSNGSDAVWNACLFTGFPAGAIPFVDGSGSLAHNSTRLIWDNAARRLGVGVDAPASTLMVYDSAAGTGETTVTVRAGAGQQTTALQRWQGYSGTDLAKVEADGSLQALSVKAATGTKAAWQETGGTADPASPGNGDHWYNTTEQARKTYEAAQTHTLPQVICSIAGSATNSTTPVSLGRCRIPSGMLRGGDRFDVRYDLSHEGVGAAFSFAAYWIGTALAVRSGAAPETGIYGRTEVIPQGSSIWWSWENWGTVSLAASGTGSSTGLAAGDVTVEVFGQMTTSTSETVTLRNLTVVRIPAQANP